MCNFDELAICIKNKKKRKFGFVCSQQAGSVSVSNSRSKERAKIKSIGLSVNLGLGQSHLKDGPDVGVLLHVEVHSLGIKLCCSAGVVACVPAEWRKKNNKWSYTGNNKNFSLGGKINFIYLLCFYDTSSCNERHFVFLNGAVFSSRISQNRLQII